MAWQYQITKVSGTVASVDENNQPIIIDLTKQGRFTLQVDYFDDTDPTTILHTHGFELTSTSDMADVIRRIKDTGMQIRTARARVEEITTQMDKAQPID